jgi:hypothetical protein
MFLGRDAGLNSSGVTNSIFLGINAGQNTSHPNSIIISNKSLGLADDVVYPVEWADHNTPFILDIGHGIQGVLTSGPSSAVGGHTYDSDANDDVRLHIGPALRKADVDASRKLKSRTLEVQPSKSDDTVLVLDQPGTDILARGKRTSGSPLLLTAISCLMPQLSTYGTHLRDGLGGDTNEDQHMLDVINRHGFPVIPYFTKYVSGELLTGAAPTVGANGKQNIIPRYPGAFAVGWANTTSVTGNEEYVLAICVYAREVIDQPQNTTRTDSDGLLWKFIKLSNIV